MLLEKLSNAAGPSGFEGEVREIIKEEIVNYVDEMKVDVMGSIIAHKKGNGAKVLIDAHMDEVGFIITGYNQDGTLRFESLGGINGKVLLSKVVLIGKNKITGVIGFKPIHLQNADERKKNVKASMCCIDIGSSSKEETKKVIKIGEFAVFQMKYGKFGDGLVKGKAFDDRMGCAIAIEILKGNYNCDLYVSFNVQEEVGERGTYVSAFNIQPDIGVALEGTICADMPGIPKHLSATEIGKGPALSIMDKTSIFDDEILKTLIKVAEDKDIPYQLRRSTAGGNDAGAILMSGDGAKVATVSVPCRYIHSSVSVASIEDYKNTVRLMVEWLKTF
ncbi:M42 family metallopeptidase [Clostridium tagluense]|uniref:M42 family metallopeptidase n=1 Tax=Clostridium tagluense TaxID=360422 RepID=UPI001C6DD48D|nr:M42 family metallopeptidase [Clostridium tagluense]MBW9158842.1 M42 family metallopeptidase [Clostridium tagluense]WLC65803.1 M42 family metallopeptidase [Clostridium tagluense]